MFLDASAAVAILNREPGHEELLKLLDRSPTAILYSPLSRFETIVSLARSRAGPNRSATPAQIEAVKVAVDLFLSELRAESVDISGKIADGALAAAQTYGRAVGHQADLNFGDCFAYACAKDQRMSLLYKGDDFAKTDLA